MIHDNSKNEHMISLEEKKLYNDRYIIFKKFVIDNIDNF